MNAQIEEDTTLNLLEEQVDMLVDDSKLKDVAVSPNQDEDPK